MQPSDKISGYSILKISWKEPLTELMNFQFHLDLQFTYSKILFDYMLEHRDLYFISQQILA